MRIFKPTSKKSNNIYISDDVGNLFVAVFYSTKEGFVYPIKSEQLPKDVKKRIIKYESEYVK